METEPAPAPRPGPPAGAATTDIGYHPAMRTLSMMIGLTALGSLACLGACGSAERRRRSRAQYRHGGRIDYEVSEHRRGDERAGQARQAEKCDRDEQSTPAHACNSRCVGAGDADDDERHHERNDRHADRVDEQRAERLDVHHDAFDRCDVGATQQQTERQAGNERDENPRAERWRRHAPKLPRSRHRARQKCEEGVHGGRPLDRAECESTTGAARPTGSTGATRLAGPTRSFHAAARTRRAATTAVTRLTVVEIGIGHVAVRLSAARRRAADAFVTLIATIGAALRAAAGLLPRAPRAGARASRTAGARAASRRVTPWQRIAVRAA